LMISAPSWVSPQLGQRGFCFAPMALSASSIKKI